MISQILLSQGQILHCRQMFARLAVNNLVDEMKLHRLTPLASASREAE